MNHYVYLIVNNINNKKYIGKRSCSCPIEQDNYMGSGKALKQAQKKYGIDNFTKHILLVCDTEEQAFEEEKRTIELAGAVESDRYYNIAYGGKGGLQGIKYSEEDLRERRKNVVNIFTGEIFKDIDIINNSKDLKYFNFYKGKCTIENNLSMFKMDFDNKNIALIDLKNRIENKEIYVYEDIYKSIKNREKNLKSELNMNLEINFILDDFLNMCSYIEKYDDCYDYLDYDIYDEYEKSKSNHIDTDIDIYDLEFYEDDFKYVN